MSEKSLQEIVLEIKYLIEQGKARDALPLTHLLLSHYPRYIQGYQLLAEIALDEGYTADAIEVFRRILSADPENFVAHAGLAVAYKNQKQISDALWHIHRAFEIEPRWREVREEVRSISELHSGHRPGRLRLNGVALGRMYMREGQYDKAAQQLKSEVETEEDNRVDLLVALAESEWFAQRHEQAVQTARQVLQELPLCLKINLILGQFYAQQDDLESADYFLRVAQQLDPANELSAAWFGKAGYLQAREVIIPLHDDLNQNGNQNKMPKWLSNLSLFAVDDTAEEQERQAVTSIDEFDESFDLSESTESTSVDANPIAQADNRPLISIDSDHDSDSGHDSDSDFDFDFDLSSEPVVEPTGTREPQPSSDWANRGLIEPNIIEEPIQPSSSPSASLSPAPSSVDDAVATPTPTQSDWREALRTESWAALNERSALEASSTAAEVASQANWVARLRTETGTALDEHLTQYSQKIGVNVTQTSEVSHGEASHSETEEVSHREASHWRSPQIIEQVHLTQSAAPVVQEQQPPDIAAKKAEAQEQTLSSSKEDTLAQWKEALASATHAALAETKAIEVTKAAEVSSQKIGVNAPQTSEALRETSEVSPQGGFALAQRPIIEQVPALAETKATEASSQKIGVNTTRAKPPRGKTSEVSETSEVSPSAQGGFALAPIIEEVAFEAPAAMPPKLDWHHRLMAATHAALADYEAVQSEKETSAEMVAPLEWRQQLKRETDTALADYDTQQSEKEAPIGVVPALEWRQRLISATHAALAEYEAEQETKSAAPSTISEEHTPTVVDEPAKATWKEALKAATDAQLASWTISSAIQEPQEEVETTIDQVLIAESTPTIIEESQEKVETVIDQVLIAQTTPTIIEEPQQEVEQQRDEVATTAMAPPSEAIEAVQSASIPQTEEIEPTPEARQRLSKRWIEGLRFETEVWLATVRRAHRESGQTGPLQEPSTVPIVAKEEPIAIKPPLEIAQEPSKLPIVAEEEPIAIQPPLEITQEPVDVAEEEPSAIQSPLEITQEPVDVAPAAGLPLAQDAPVEPELPDITTQPVSSEPDEATRPWVNTLRAETEQELATESTWVAPLHQATQAELTALSTQPPTWIAALRAATDTQLADVAQKAELISQIPDMGEEISEPVAEIVPETTPVVTTEEQIREPVAQVAPEMTPVVTAEEQIRPPVAQIAPETPKVVTVEEEISPPVTQIVPEMTPVVTVEEQISEPVALIAPETTPVVTAEEQISEPAAEVAAKTPKVVSTEEEISESVAEIAPETSEVVTAEEEISESAAEIVPETPEVVSAEEEVSEPVAQIAPETAPVVRAEEEIREPVAQIVPETTPVVTAEEDIREPVAQIAPETTPVVRAEEEIRPPVAQIVPETPEVVTAEEDIREPVAQIAPETTEVVTTSEPKTTEVVTTSEEVSLPAIDRAPDAELTSQTPDVTDTIYQSIPEVHAISPSRTNGTAIHHPVPQDKWQLARQAWQVGEHKEAYTIYQTFFNESDEYDTQLDEALSAWTRTDDAPFLAFQLLGDVYRRMRRMQEAVKQYREAINRI